MSKSSAREFLVKLNSDEGYRTEVEQLVGDDEDALIAVVGHAKRDGFDFTSSELEAAMSELAPGELSDAALDEVSGGFNPQPEPPGTQDPRSNLRNLLRGRFRRRF